MMHCELRIVLRSLTHLVVAAGMAASTPLAAQGTRLDLTLFAIQPSLAARSSEVFAGLGRFRPSLGADFGLGYDIRDVGVTVSGAMAGVEVGAPVTRNGIGMGRETGIYESVALLGSWRPPRHLGQWRPTITGGFMASSIDNVFLRADSLPEYARALTAEPPDSVRRLVGVSGSGIRVAASMERPISATDFSGRMALAVELVADIVRYREASYDGRRTAIPDPGTSVSPRLGISLRWSPRARPDVPGSP